MRMKSGDLYPFQYDLRWDDGTAIDLTLASSVTFYMTKDGNTIADVSGSCTVVSAADGRVKYTWQDGETDAVGMYKVEFLITYNDGSKVTVPSDDIIWLHIIQSLK